MFVIHSNRDTICVTSKIFSGWHIVDEIPFSSLPECLIKRYTDTGKMTIVKMNDYRFTSEH